MPVPPFLPDANPPPWLDAPARRALMAAWGQAGARGQDPYAAALDLAQGRYPALPRTLLHEAVAWVQAAEASGR